jgi:hypothetical protein
MDFFYMSIKGKAVPQHTYADAGGRGDIAPLIFDLDSRWR